MTPAPLVVTGLGVVAPTGIGAEAHWATTLRGACAIDRITRFDPSGYPATMAGEIRDFDAKDHLPSRVLAQTDRMTRLVLVAAREALGDAGFDPEQTPADEVGVVTAASGGGVEFGQRAMQALCRGGPTHVSAYQSFAWFYPVNSGQISIMHNLRGPGAALVTEQAGGIDAVAKAARHLRAGARLMVAGGVDSALSPWGWLCTLRSGRLATSDDPASSYVPFDRRASGYTPGEGGALLVLEPEGERDVRGYGVIAGHASTFDPPPVSGRGSTLRRAIELALADARVRPGDVDVVFADAYGMPELDRVEAEAIAAVFGPSGVPVTAPKTMTGRLSAGGAALDLATALLSLTHGVVPPTVNVTEPAYPHLVDLVTAPREQRLGCVLVLARGHGGFNSAMVLRRARERNPHVHNG